MRSIRNEKGFTLIELAIVLVIIGLILGSVIKGKDLINSAKQKNFYTSFIEQWTLAVASYYDRTGYLLGDGTANGGTAGTANGRFDNINGANFDAGNGIDATLEKVGLEVPSTNTNESGQMTYSGSNTSQTVTLSLSYINANNRLSLTNMPTDLAIALDRIIDGQVDATDGNFRRNPDTSAWPDVTATATVNATVLINLP